MSTACDFLRENVDRIFARWHELVEQHQKLPAEMGADALPALLETLTNAFVCRVEPRAAQEQLVRLAAEHGRERQEAGRPRHTVFSEYHILRDAIWTTLREELTIHDAADAIIHIDAGITICILASLRGYHGIMPDPGATFQDLMDLSPFP